MVEDMKSLRTLTTLFHLMMVLSFTSGEKDLSEKQNVWETGDKYEGDIKVHPTQEKNGLIASRWKNHVMPYIIDSTFDDSQKKMIMKVIEEYHKVSCVRFVPRKESDVDYVRFKNDEPGCWSYVGCVGGEQQINFDKYCFKIGVLEHEMLHAWGFFHQQSDTERDKFVKIKWENIKKGMNDNFEKYGKSVITNFGEPYDYDSVMHYSAYAFTKNGHRTIVPKKATAKIGQRKGLSKGDIRKLNKMYQCPEAAD